MKAIAMSGLLALCAPCAQAQCPSPHPYVYFWDKPDAAIPISTDDGSVMVRDFADSYYNNPQAAGQAFASRAWQQVNVEHVTRLDRVCIVLQNFGLWKDGVHQVSLIDPLDAVTPAPSWETPNGPEYPFMPYMQPWMVNGRQSIQQWMQGFLQAYAQAGGPRPARFQFDSEVYLSSCCEVNWTRLLWAVAGDARWTTTDVPGYPAGTKMQALYNQAITDYGWPNYPLNDPGLHALRFDQVPSSDTNRKYFLWFWGVCQRAVDGALNECAYSLIRAQWPEQPPLPACKVANYEHCNTDAKRDTFGWYTGQSYTGSPSLSWNPIATNQSVRGQTNLFQSGAQYIWNDFTHHLGQSDEVRSLWDTRPSHTSADFSVPAIFKSGPWHYGSDRVQYYLKDHPPATDTSIMLANGRRWVESIINSGNSPASVTPWLPVTNSEFPYGPSVYSVRHEEFVQILAMLRAKNISEVLAWVYGQPSTSHLGDLWALVIADMGLVYRPNLASFSVIEGGVPISWPSGAVQTNPDLLRYTLRTGNLWTEQVLASSFGPVNGPQRAALKVAVNNLACAQGNMILNLECSVNTPSAAVSGLRGQIFVWDGVDWVKQTGADFDDFGVGSGFGFFAPADQSGWYETRRAFKNLYPYISNGAMDIKIVLLSAPGGSGFDARFDLVQPVEWPYLLMLSQQPKQGADFDYSGVVDQNDLNAFVEAWSFGKLAADFNNDGIVNTADLLAFLWAYTG